MRHKVSPIAWLLLFTLMYSCAVLPPKQKPFDRDDYVEYCEVRGTGRRCQLIERSEMERILREMNRPNHPMQNF